jgi:hypothetical protein
MWKLTVIYVRRPGQPFTSNEAGTQIDHPLIPQDQRSGGALWLMAYHLPGFNVKNLFTLETNPPRFAASWAMSSLILRLYRRVSAASAMALR